MSGASTPGRYIAEVSPSLGFESIGARRIVDVFAVMLSALWLRMLSQVRCVCVQVTMRTCQLSPANLANSRSSIFSRAFPLCTASMLIIPCDFVITRTSLPHPCISRSLSV